MLAHHPITGEPINILRTKSQLSAEEKTLVWIRSTFKPSHRWSRWFCVVSEPDAVSVCGADALTAILLPPGSVAADWASVFPTILSGECLVVGAAATVEAFAAAGLESERTLIVEDLYDAYPFLGEPVAAADPLSKWVVSLAHVLRMNRIAWSEGVDRAAMVFGLGAQVDAWNRSCGCLSGAQSLLSLTADAADSVVPAMWLIQQYFVHSAGRRAKEIRNCLERNIECPFVDHILLLNEKPYAELDGKAKVQTVEIGHRMRYNDVFNAIRTHVPAGDYVVFANSDIVFDSTLRHVWRLPMVRRRLFLELLRWEDGDTPTIFGPRSDSQDAWIVARNCCDFDPVETDFGFPFGKPGCDNAIGVLMMRQRFLVSNPAYSIKTYHVHASAVRNYEPKDVLYKKHFLYVDPTAIQNFAVVSDLRGATYAPPEAAGVAWRGKSLGRSFRRPLLCDDADGLATVCTMLKRADVPYEYSAEGVNLWTPAPGQTPLYRLQGGTFMTAGGLVSNFREILIGAHPMWAAGWEHANSSTLTGSVHVPHLVCAPFHEGWSTDLSSWVLHYLPRALAIRRIAAESSVKAEFLVPQTAMIGDFLEDCVWNSDSERGNINVVPYLKDMNYYSTDIWAVPPTEDALVTAEDVDVLRELLPQTHVPSSETPVVVFMVEDDVDALCTRSWAESVAENVFHDAWTVRYVSATDSPAVRRKALCDANWIVGRGAALNWMWMAGAGATVLDFQRIDSPVGDYAHLAGACGLRYVLGAVKREPIINSRQNALLTVARALPAYGFKDVAATKATKSKPKIIVPSGAGLEGLWSHCGDTFREMADLWAERGYVQLEKSEDTHYCWWGGVGEVLLYDRPTARWWTAPPPSYQMALFGNCAPPGPAAHLLRQSVWSFWGRSPRALEGVALRRENVRGWSSRSIESLFLGKVENGVQLAGRTGSDWSRAVSLFSMPIDSTGKPYPFTQEQYLEKLCNARFGLCLPGFGPKCNREIEYFCCGVVPIVTPGVDMKGYLVPPIEGIHYLTAKTPEEVAARIKETSAEKWAAMSAAGRQWWRTYASAEGLYRLTWARIEQCRPYVNSGIPPKFVF